MGHIFWNESFRLMDSGEQVEVLAIGDSWFHYPFNNLITPLYEALERPTIYVIGQNGARADDLSEGSWLKNFARMLDGYPAIQLVCISASGNDFAGVGDLDDRILAEDCNAATTVGTCYQPNEPAGVFDAIQEAYGELIEVVGARRPDVTVLLHNYDYAIPDGRSLPGVPCWLKLPMDNRRVPTAGAPMGGLRREIVRDLVDRFTLCLDAVETQGDGVSVPRTELFWTAGTLRDSEWANELHPTPAGFNRLVAECWAGPAHSAWPRMTEASRRPRSIFGALAGRCSDARAMDEHKQGGAHG